MAADEQNPAMQSGANTDDAQTGAAQPDTTPPQAQGEASTDKSRKPQNANKPQRKPGGASARSVLGIGFGRIASIAGVSVVALLALWGAFGVRSNKMEKPAKVDMPNVPKAPMNVALTPEERQRRQEQAQREFERAQRAGESYQVAIEMHDREEYKGETGEAGFKGLREAQDQKGKSTRQATKKSSGSQDKNGSGVIQATTEETEQAQAASGRHLLAGMRTGPIMLGDEPIGGNADGGNANDSSASSQKQGAQPQSGSQQSGKKGKKGQQAPSMQEQIAAARAKEEAEFQEKLARARQAREEYIAGVRQQGILQARLLTGDDKGGSVFGQMGLSTGAVWMTQQTTSQDAMVASDRSISGDAEGVIDEDFHVVLGAGEMLYATLDAEVDTDDGDLVLATIRGGKFDGRRVMGRVEKTNDNIRLHFDTMSGRKRGNRVSPSVPIDAIALRAEDAKQGVADIKDRHLISRLAAVAVTALLTGYGDAWGTTSGTTRILENGTVITTTEDPTNKRIRGNVARQLGTTLANEFSDEIHRQPTYKVMAGKGFVLLILQDLDQSEMDGRRWRDPSLYNSRARYSSINARRRAAAAATPTASAPAISATPR
ncbi:MAG: DotG/IcmE/VirB10 family protein [Actinomycetaceae bacterium]|nr:DotG/IcmE/VirB10 family protein [Actinomycetaceae bacterium]